MQVGFLPVASSPATVTFGGVLLQALQPFLMRGGDVGDRVIPGSAVVLPGGGLRVR